MIYITIVLFLLAGLGEIGGGYLIRLWLREGRPFYYGILGAVRLTFYGIVATFQSFPSFGRVSQHMEGFSLFYQSYGDGE